MTNRLSDLRPRDISFMLVGGIVAVALSGTAIAVTSANFTYTNEKTGYLSIHPTDLSPYVNDILHRVDWGHPDPAFFMGDGGCATTGTNLPQGARVVSLVTYYTALEGDAFNPAMHFFRAHLASNAANILVSKTATDTSGDRKSMTGSIPGNLSVIRNDTHSYGFAICLGQGDTFRGARLTYKYSTAGD